MQSTLLKDAKNHSTINNFGMYLRHGTSEPYRNPPCLAKIPIQCPNMADGQTVTGLG